MRLFNLLLAGSVSFLATTSAVACDDTCNPSRFMDGDTIIMLCPDGQHKIRLRDIDAPELKQPYGPEAAEHLKQLLEGKQVCINWHGKDLYKRDVADIFTLDNGTWTNVNMHMVMDGYAWSYEHRRAGYNKLEDYARDNHLGLWKDASPEAPWEYRFRMKALHHKAK